MFTSCQSLTLPGINPSMANPEYDVLPIPPFPQTQVLSSTTFTLPPLDGSLTIPEIYDFHLQHSPNHPLYVYSDDSSSECIIPFRRAVRAIHRAGGIIRTRLGTVESLSKRPIVAILAMTGMPYLIPFERAIFEHLADS